MFNSKEILKNPEAFVKLLYDENPEAFRVIHDLVKPHIKRLGIQYRLLPQDIEELILDCLTIFIQKIKLGEYEYQGYEPHAYVLSIARLQVNNYSRKAKKSFTESLDDIEIVEESYNLQSEPIELLNKLLTKLGGICEKIIRIKYIDEYKDAEAIDNLMVPFTSVDALKNHRSRCLKKLIELSKNNKFVLEYD